MLRKIRRKPRRWQPRIELAVDVLLFEQTVTPCSMTTPPGRSPSTSPGSSRSGGTVVTVDHVSSYMKALELRLQSRPLRSMSRSGCKIGGKQNLTTIGRRPTLGAAARPSGTQSSAEGVIVYAGGVLGFELKAD